MNRLIIIGAGGHGKVVASCAEDTKRFDEICFLDDSGKTEVLGFKVVGKTSDIEKFVSDSQFIVAIGNNEARKNFCQTIENLGGKLATIVHPSVVIGKQAVIENGTFVSANAVINPSAQIGKGAIINTSAVVEHDCVIGDYTHICPAVAIAGTVNVGNFCTLGIGTKVSNNVNICDRTILGAGSVVVKDIIEAGTYVGVPAKKIK